MSNPSDLELLLDTLMVRGLEALKKYVGPYRANVTRNDDPEARGRIQVVCPRAGHTTTLDKWVKPSFIGAGDNRGVFWPPDVGDTVFVFFTNGDPAEPELYIGGWPGKDEVAPEFGYSPQTVTNSSSGKQTKNVPERRGLRTRKGHRLLFTDETGEEALELLWNKPLPSDEAFASDTSGVRDETYQDGDQSYFKIDKTGSITLRTSTGAEVNVKTDGTVNITNAEGSSMTMRGKTITVTADTVNVDASRTNMSGSKYSMILGELLLDYILTHEHPTPVGLSGPPVKPPPSNILSKKNKLG